MGRGPSLGSTASGVGVRSRAEWNLGRSGTRRIARGCPASSTSGFDRAARGGRRWVCRGRAAQGSAPTGRPVTAWPRRSCTWATRPRRAGSGQRRGPPAPALRLARLAAADLAALDFAAAERTYRAALELDPGLGEAWFGLALLHTQRGDAAAVLAAARQGLKQPLTPAQDCSSGTSRPSPPRTRRCRDFRWAKDLLFKFNRRGGVLVAAADRQRHCAQSQECQARRLGDRGEARIDSNPNEAARTWSHRRRCPR